MNGGTIKSDNLGISNYMNGKTKVTVNDGLIETKGANIKGIDTSLIDLNITEGNFKTEHTSNLDIYSSNSLLANGIKPVINISGGNFESTNTSTVNNLNVFIDGTNNITKEQINEYFDIEINNGTYTHGVSKFTKHFPLGMYQVTENGSYKLKNIENVESTLPEEITRPVIVTITENIKNILINSVSTNEELVNKISEATKNVTTQIKVEEITNIGEDLKIQINTILPNDNTLVGYYDIKAIINIDGIENEINELDSKIKLSVILPETLKNVPEGSTRKYYITREHDGIVELIDVKLNNDKLEFESDKFSTYAISYVDSVAVTNPDTGINTNLYITILVVGLLSVITLLKLRNN